MLLRSLTLSVTPLAAASLLALPAAIPPARAQAFPTKSITIVVPFAPGGSADATARTLANELGGRTGVSVVIENKGGGGGVIGLQSMARSEPDGHTVAIGAAGAVSIVPILPGAPPFDPVREMAPVAKLVDVPNVIVAHPGTGPRTLADAIVRAKATPAGLTFGSTGAKSSQHLSVEFIGKTAGAKLVHVPYRGSGPAVTDAVAGQIPMAAVDLTSAHALIRDGKLTALALTAEKRTDLAPDIPSLTDAGFPGFKAAPWLGLFAPANTPPAVIRTLSGHMAQILAKPEVREQIRRVSLDPSYLDEAAFKAFLAADAQAWRDIIKTIGPIE